MDPKESSLTEPRKEASRNPHSPTLKTHAALTEPQRPLVWGLGFGDRGLGFGVWGLGCGVWGVGFGVWGLGFGVRPDLRRSDKDKEVVCCPQVTRNDYTICRDSLEMTLSSFCKQLSIVYNQAFLGSRSSGECEEQRRENLSAFAEKLKEVVQKLHLTCRPQKGAHTHTHTHVAHQVGESLEGAPFQEC